MFDINFRMKLICSWLRTFYFASPCIFLYRVVSVMMKCRCVGVTEAWWVGVVGQVLSRHCWKFRQGGMQVQERRRSGKYCFSVMIKWSFVVVIVDVGCQHHTLIWWWLGREHLHLHLHCVILQSPSLHVSLNTLRQFQSRLKTILFHLVYGTWFGAFVTI